MSWFESVLRIECYLVLLVPTLLSCMLLLLSLALKKSCGGGCDVNHYDHLQAEIEMHVVWGGWNHAGQCLRQKNAKANLDFAALNHVLIG